MRIQFSDHALERIRSPNLTTDQIKEAIANPDEKLSNRFGRIAHKILNDDSQEKSLLRVFYEENEDEILIISAYKTSKIEKYWKGGFNED